MSTTVRDLIKGSMRLISAIATGETPSSDELNDGLFSLNSMLDSWSTESLFIYATQKETFQLIPGKQTYTMGTGGDFATTRPQKIQMAFVELLGTSPTSELALDILTLDQWANIVTKNIQSTLPTKLYAEYTNPLCTVNIFPAPATANNLNIYSWKPFSKFATLNDAIALPPGYERAIRYSLALEIAPEYGKQVSPDVQASAVNSKAAIKRMNIKPELMVCEIGLSSDGRRFNILTGE